jgi:hypothetical protein
VEGCCKRGNEPAGSGATVLVTRYEDNESFGKP